MDNNLVGLSCSSDDVGFETIAKSTEQAPCSEMAVDTGTRSKEQNLNPKEEKQQIVDDSVVLDSRDGRLICNMQQEAVNPQFSATNIEIMTRSQASMVNEGQSERNMNIVSQRKLLLIVSLKGEKILIENLFWWRI